MKAMLFRMTLFALLLHAAGMIRAQEWEPTSSPPDFTSDHTYGFALEGLGYLVAGTTEFEGPTDAFLQYDPQTDTWTTLEPFPGPGRGYGIGDILDGKAYFGFGVSVDSMLNDLWVFDPTTMEWTQLASCPCEARIHPAFIAHQGKIFVGLGNNNSGNQNDWWEYTIATNTWAQKPDFPAERRHHPYQFAMGDYVYTGLGHGSAGIFRNWFQYDPATEEWTEMASIPGEGRVAGTQFVHGHLGFVLSGDGDDHLSMETGEFYSYNAWTDTWSELPAHPGKSRWAPSSFVLNGWVYLFNGTTYFPAMGSVYQTDSYKFNLDDLIASTKPTPVDISVQLFPNPATDILQFDIEPSTYSRYSIHTLDGKNIQSGLLSNNSVSVNALSSGTYVLKLFGDAKEAVGRFVRL